MSEAVRVLLIEDNPGDADLICEMLPEEGPISFKISHVESLADAFRDYAGGAYDLVLLDLNLPDSSGIETIRATRARDADIPIIVLTGADDDEMVAEAIRAGAQDYLVKGQVTENHLARLVHYSVQRHYTQERMHESQKLETIGVLAGGIAHDFNNLLTVILGNAEHALADLGGAELKQCLEEIRSSATEAAKLCDQMLSYAGRRADTMQPVELNSLVETIIRLTAVARFKHIKLNLNLSSQEVRVLGNESSLEQVVMNLITNAMESCEENEGEVTVTTRLCALRPDESPTSWISKDASSTQAFELVVADTGKGMSAETQRKLFDPFFTTKFTGRGLGLAAVLGIVQAHKGSIHFRSRVGEGTEFVLTFPVHQEEPCEAAQPSAAMERTPVENDSTILIADDEQVILKLYERMLSRLGFKTILTQSGKECLEALAAHESRFYCVVLDMTMPGMNGLETFRELRKMDSDVPVVICSGYSEEDVFADAGEAHGLHFLQKPFSLKSLEHALLEKINGR